MVQPRAADPAAGGGCGPLDIALHHNVLCGVELGTAMKELNDALDEISAIRAQIARSVEFRGFGPLTVAATGLLALGAAEIQVRAFPAAEHDVSIFLALWVTVAVAAAGLIAAEMVIRSRVIHSGLAPEMIASAVESLVPSGVTGMLLTAVLVRCAPEAVWMLPGIWQILLGLGVCASARFLPRAILIMASWYITAGLVCIWWLAITRALSPWAMGLPFGAGQLLAAAILQLSQEKGDAAFDQE
jgi:hypothetical protein